MSLVVRKDTDRVLICVDSIEFHGENFTRKFMSRLVRKQRRMILVLEVQIGSNESTARAGFAFVLELAFVRNCPSAVAKRTR
jgi:hypothetical protein